MDGKRACFAGRHLILGALAFVWLVASPRAHAAVVELSAMVSYSSSKFDTNYSSEQRRYTGTFDLKFTPVSAIEFEYTNESTEYSYPSDLGLLAVPTREQQSYKDTIYSLNWVQSLVSSKWILQPYVVIGGGRMTRRISMSLPDIPFSQVTTQNVIEGTGGFGLRLFLTRTMALKGEVKTYVPNFQFSKWKDNEALSVGLSWAF